MDSQAGTGLQRAGPLARPSWPQALLEWLQPLQCKEPWPRELPWPPRPRVVARPWQVRRRLLQPLLRVCLFLRVRRLVEAQVPVSLQVEAQVPVSLQRSHQWLPNSRPKAHHLAKRAREQEAPCGLAPQPSPSQVTWQLLGQSRA